MTVPPREALADFNRAIELDPDATWLLVRRGPTYQAMGRYADALADFCRATDLDPDDAWAISNRGEIYREMGR